MKHLLTTIAAVLLVGVERQAIQKRIVRYLTFYSAIKVPKKEISSDP